MSELKKRSVTEIQADYSNTCARAGHVQYQLRNLEKDLKLINEQLESLNFEAAASARMEEEDKKKAAATKDAEPETGLYPGTEVAANV